MKRGRRVGAVGEGLRAGCIGGGTEPPTNFKETITLGPQFHNQPQEGQSRVLVHEMLHALAHKNDIGLARDLFGGTYGTMQEASSTISNWLRDGCP